MRLFYFFIISYKGFIKLHWAKWFYERIPKEPAGWSLQTNWFRGMAGSGGCLCVCAKSCRANSLHHHHNTTTTTHHQATHSPSLPPAWGSRAGPLCWVKWPGWGLSSRLVLFGETERENPPYSFSARFFLFFQTFPTNFTHSGNKHEFTRSVVFPTGLVWGNLNSSKFGHYIFLFLCYTRLGNLDNMQKMLLVTAKLNSSILQDTNWRLYGTVHL